MKHTTLIFTTIIISACVIGGAAAYVVTTTVQQPTKDGTVNYNLRSNTVVNQPTENTNNTNRVDSTNEGVQEIDAAALYEKEPTTTKTTTLKTDRCPALLEYPATWTIDRPADTMDSIEMYSLQSEATVAFLQNLQDRGLVSQTAMEDFSVFMYQSTANYIGSIGSTESTLEKVLNNTPGLGAQDLKKTTIGGKSGFMFQTGSADGSYTYYVTEVNGKVFVITDTQRNTTSKNYTEAIARIIDSIDFTSCK